LLRRDAHRADNASGRNVSKAENKIQLPASVAAEVTRLKDPDLC
jgi:hypothetical protein